MKKFLLILLALILVGLIAFHFIAANQAEQHMDEAIQMQADSLAVPMSVQYSAIDISPFSGDVELRDVTVVINSNIERANRINIDLRYLDFLNMTIGGFEYGMKNISSADMDLTTISYLNRNTMQEASLASAKVHYEGNLLDGIRTLILEEPLVSAHQFNVSGAQFAYSKPNSTIGNFKSDSVFFRYTSPRTNENAKSPENSFQFQSISWDPPSRFRKKYGFFIQGFGYSLNAIPLSKSGSSFSLNENHITIENGETITDLFTLHFNGTIVKDSTWSAARFSPLTLQIVEPSQQFQNVLANIEQLLGISLSEGQEKVQFQLQGPITNPRFSRGASR